MDRSWRLPIRISVLGWHCSRHPAQCRDQTSSTPTSSGTAATSPSAPTSFGSNSPVPVTTGLPQETCAAFLPKAPCATYASVAATSNGKALPWSAAGTIKARLTSAAGTLHLVMRTDCAPVGGPATIAGNIMTIGSIATGASGCIGTAGQ